MIRSIAISGLALLFASLAGAQTSVRPRIFFTDIQSGPKTGGENNNGAFVTIYGNNFGASPAVTVGGGSVSLKLAPTAHLWYQKMVIQLGPNAATGNIIVSNSNGSSNGLPFTVRSGNIYFSTVAGNDSTGNGSFASPWRTITKCKNALNAGDICYIGNGVNQLSNEQYSAADLTARSGTAAAPIALLTYPGASAQIGSPSTQRGILTWGSYNIIGGFNIQGYIYAVEFQSSNNVVVGNTMYCSNVPAGTQEGCLQSSSASFNNAFGNDISATGAGGTNPGKYYHGVYFGADGHDFELAWNNVHLGSTGGCRGIQFYNSGINSYNINLHDNVVHDTPCDGLNLAAINANNGYIKVYNNLVYHVGTGETTGTRACLQLSSQGSAAPTSKVEAYNNTFYDCSVANDYPGAVQGGVPVNMRNNIIYVLSTAAPYYSDITSYVTGSNNVYYGNGSGPSQTTGNINQNPQFVNAGARDFHLLSSSPAIDAGVNTAIAAAIDGVARPQGSAFDVGAYEFATQSQPVPTSACDLNSDSMVTQADVDIAIAQALGTAACSNADLDGSGKCDAVDLQRVVNAALPGGTCRVGP